MECGSEASAHAEANASALQTGQRAAPLSHSVGEGLGVRAKKRCVPAHSELKRCTLISPPNLPRTRGRSRDSLPACGEGWGGGAMFKSLCKDTYL
jgi:hypothetical protein